MPVRARRNTAKNLKYGNKNVAMRMHPVGSRRDGIDQVPTPGAPPLSELKRRKKARSQTA